MTMRDDCPDSGCVVRAKVFEVYVADIKFFCQDPLEPDRA